MAKKYIDADKRKNEYQDMIFCVMILAIVGIAGFYIGGTIAFLTHAF
jgi:hypothetical protein